MFIKLTGNCEKQAMIPIENIACIVEGKKGSNVFFKRCSLESIIVKESVDIIYEKIKTLKYWSRFIKLTTRQKGKAIVSVDSIACVKEGIITSDVFFKQCSLKLITVKDPVDLIYRKVEKAKRLVKFIKLTRTFGGKVMTPIDNIACVVEGKRISEIFFKQCSLKSITAKEPIGIIYSEIKAMDELVEFIILTKKRARYAMVPVENIQCVVDGIKETYVFFEQCAIESVTVKEPTDIIYQKVETVKEIVYERKESG